MAEFRIGVVVDVTAETAEDAYAQVVQTMLKTGPDVSWESTDEWLTWGDGEDDYSVREVPDTEVVEARTRYFEKAQASGQGDPE